MNFVTALLQKRLVNSSRDDACQPPVSELPSLRFSRCFGPAASRRRVRALVCVSTLAMFFCLAALDGRASAETAEFQWSARMSASEEYETNINLKKEEDHDWITLVGPGLTLTIKTGETEARLDYDLGFSYYASHHEDNSVRHSLTMSGFRGIPITEHMTLDLDESLQISEEPIETSSYVTSERHTRDRYYRNTSGVRVNYHFGEGSYFYTGFHHIYLANDDPEIADSQSYHPTAGIIYWFDIRNGVSLDYAYERGKFDAPDESEDFTQHIASITYMHRFTPRTQANLSYTYDSFDYDSFDYNGIREDYKVHSSSLGLSHQFTENVSGSISGGYYFQDRKRSSDKSGFIGDASLDGAFRFEKGSITLNTSTGYRQQFFEAENLGFSRYYNATAAFNYRLREKLVSTLGGLYQRDEYLETVTDRKDNLWSASVTLSYQISHWLSASLGYAYWQRDSTLDENDSRDNRFTVMLDLGKAFGYISKPRPIF
jgi:predicted porin